MTDTRGLYEMPGVATTYHAARALPDETAAQWTALVRAALAGLDVRHAVDVGAGEGRFTRILRAAVDGRVIAIERSLEMIRARDGSAFEAFVQGVAEALPVRTASVDVVQLSMVYHQLRDAPVAVAEVRRVLCSGGRALVRTPTRETIGRFRWMRFFPEALALDLARMPGEADLPAGFERAGFRLRTHEIVSQRIANGLADYVARVRTRAYSSLQGIPDDAWHRGFAAFEAHCRSAPDGPVDEPVNFFVFETT